MSFNKTLATAALAGLMTTTCMAPAFAADDNGAVNGAAMVKAEKTDTAKEKHACKGQNSCKGQGADGKNACKGKGSCATNGAK